MVLGTHDLGNGWYANLRLEGGAEVLTIRNPDKGQRIELGETSVRKLREICAAEVAA